MAIQIQLAMPQAQPTAAVAFSVEDGADFDTQFSLEQAASDQSGQSIPEPALRKAEPTPARRQQAAAAVESSHQRQSQDAATVDSFEVKDTALLEQIPTELELLSATEPTSLVLITANAEAMSENKQSLLPLEASSAEDVPVLDAQAEHSELLDIIESARSYEPVATQPRAAQTDLASTIPSWAARKEAQQQLLESQTPELTLNLDLGNESATDDASGKMSDELQQRKVVANTIASKFTSDEANHKDTEPSLVSSIQEASLDGSSSVEKRAVKQPDSLGSIAEQASKLQSSSVIVETNVQAESQVVDVKDQERAPTDSIELPLPAISAQLSSVSAAEHHQEQPTSDNAAATAPALVKAAVGELTPEATQLEQVAIFQQQSQAASTISTQLKPAPKLDNNDAGTLGRSPLASKRPSLQGTPSESMPTDRSVSTLKTEPEVSVLTAAQTLNASTTPSNPASLVASTVVASVTTNSTVPGSLNSLTHAMSMTNTTGKVHGLDSNGLLSQAGLDLTQSNAGHKIVEQVMYQIQQKVQTAEVRLHPEELGAMNIKVSLQQDQLSVQFIVQHAAAKEALEQQMPRLRDLVQQQGMQLAEGQVQQRQSGQQGHSENSAGQQQNSTSGFANDTELDSDMVVANGQMTVRVSDRAVDYYA